MKITLTVLLVSIIVTWFNTDPFISGMCFSSMVFSMLYLWHGLFIKDKESPLYWKTLIREALDDKEEDEEFK